MTIIETKKEANLRQILKKKMNRERVARLLISTAMLAVMPKVKSGKRERRDQSRSAKKPNPPLNCLLLPCNHDSPQHIVVSQMSSSDPIKLSSRVLVSDCCGERCLVTKQRFVKLTTDESFSFPLFPIPFSFLEKQNQ